MTLQYRQPELNITEKDILCVQIAGLCHDLGHGPFSHMFDQLFIPTVRQGSEWKHEKASVDMFDHLIEANQLIDVFAKYGLDAQDINFIKELIKRGKKKPLRDTGRNKDKNFLYEIVANERNGIDVDKWDYFQRDCENLAISSSFDSRRFEKFCRVIEVDGEKQICTRDKEVANVYDMFYTRYSLHRRAYQHKVVKIIESMLVEALVKANDHFLVKGKEGNMLQMSEAIDDMVAYTNMTDDIILQIMRSDEPALAESRHILEMVQRRELYKFIGKTQPTQEHDHGIDFRKKNTVQKMDTMDQNTVEERDPMDQIKEDIIQAQKPEDMDGEPLEADQLIIHAVHMHYGKGPDNPIDYVRFYSKANPDQVLPRGQLLDSQMLIPKCFAEQHIRVYCKRRDDPEYIKKVSKCFQSWRDGYENKHTVQKAGNVLDSELTAEVSPTGMSTTDVDWSKDQGTPKKNPTENRQPGPPEKRRKY